MKVGIALACTMLVVMQAEAQKIVPADSTFHLGRCPQADTTTALWSNVVDEPHEQAQVIRTSIPKPPASFRDLEGFIVGRVVVALLVDSTGTAVPGSVSVEESSEGKLSTWACSAALQLRFAPATVNGKPVKTMVEQPLTYALMPTLPQSTRRSVIVNRRP